MDKIKAKVIPNRWGVKIGVVVIKQAENPNRKIVHLSDVSQQEDLVFVNKEAHQEFVDYLFESNHLEDVVER